MLTNLSNTVPDISTLIKKSDYDTKIAVIESKYVSTTGFDSKSAQVNVITKGNFDGKIIELENNIKKLQTFDSSYFRGKSHFEEDGVQTIKPYATSDNSLTPLIDYYGSKVRVKFNKSCLKQSNNLTYDYGSRVNIYIIYELGASSSNDSNPTLKNCLFGAVTFTKNADIEKYWYSGYGIGFDRRGSFSFPGGGFGQNVLIFGTDMVFLLILIIIKKHISSWNRTNTRTRPYINCRKNVFY